MLNFWFSICFGQILTLTELEATASFGLTRFLTLNSTRVACEEALILQSLLVFGVDLYECASDSETQSLALTSKTATIEICLYIIFSFGFEKLQRLFNNVLQYC
mgnify:CR=1 FL=1